MSTFSSVLHCSTTLSEHLFIYLFFLPAGFTKSVSDVLVARQPLRSGVEHKFKGASQLPDQLMTNVKVPVMSTIDYAFLLSPDLTLQKREQRHTCTKPSLPPPLSFFSLSFPASVPSFQKVDFVPICWWPRTLTYISWLLMCAPCSLSHPMSTISLICSYHGSMKSAPLTNAQGETHWQMLYFPSFSLCFSFGLNSFFLLSQATELSWSL